MLHFFNTPHAFKKIGEMQSGEMQFGEMPHTRKKILLDIPSLIFAILGYGGITFCLNNAGDNRFDSSTSDLYIGD